MSDEKLADRIARFVDRLKAEPALQRNAAIVVGLAGVWSVGTVLIATSAAKAGAKDGYARGFDDGLGKGYHMGLKTGFTYGPNGTLALPNGSTDEDELEK